MCVTKRAIEAGPPPCIGFELFVYSTDNVALLPTEVGGNPMMLQHTGTRYQATHATIDDDVRKISKQELKSSASLPRKGIIPLACTVKCHIAQKEPLDYR
jgi:hypothetical protein